MFLNIIVSILKVNSQETIQFNSVWSTHRTVFVSRTSIGQEGDERNVSHKLYNF